MKEHGTGVTGRSEFMYLAKIVSEPETEKDRRKQPRYNLQCRARIVIGTRHHAGYVSDISPTGAKLRTITPIARPGTVLLRLPDLPVLRCCLRWHDAYNAGVAFACPLDEGEFEAWLSTRSVSEATQAQMLGCEITRAERLQEREKVA